MESDRKPHKEAPYRPIPVFDIAIGDTHGTGADYHAGYMFTYVYHKKSKTKGK